MFGSLPKEYEKSIEKMKEKTHKIVIENKKKKYIPKNKDELIKYNDYYTEIKEKYVQQRIIEMKKTDEYKNNLYEIYESLSPIVLEKYCFLYIKHEGTKKSARAMMNENFNKYEENKKMEDFYDKIVKEIINENSKVFIKTNKDIVEMNNEIILTEIVEVDD